MQKKVIKTASKLNSRTRAHRVLTVKREQNAARMARELEKLSRAATDDLFLREWDQVPDTPYVPKDTAADFWHALPILQILRLPRQPAGLPVPP